VGQTLNFFKLLLPLICCHVLHVLNHAINLSVFPSMWKVAIIIRSVTRVYDTVHRLRLLKLLTSKRVRLKLCNDLLLPYLVSTVMFSVYSRRLHVAFNSCARYVFNLRRYDH
jgi:hypothetical protein